MHLSQFEKTIYAGVVAAMAGATANKGRSDPQKFAHRDHDAAMARVMEWRIHAKAYRLRRMKHRQRAARLRSKRRSERK